jgi:glycosyltransferase involved in cell wall biosynthesis
MKIAFITRSTLYKAQGGDTVQINETASHLNELGIFVTVHSAHDKIDYSNYDLLHFFNITRPADILYHIKKSKTPFVITPILIDYSEYDKVHRKGSAASVFKLFSSDTNEYIKAISRWILGKDKIQSKTFLWKGQKRSIQYILKKTSMLLPNSKKEYTRLIKLYNVTPNYTVIPNGVNEKIFQSDSNAVKEDGLIMCAARIEGLKNQYNLILALNDTQYKLLVIGHAAPNQRRYYKRCRRIAAKNIIFTGHLTQDELKSYYQKAKVHILPSWFETCGLSSLEAGAMGCNVIITDKGYAREYFEDEAFYCDPGNIDSIYNAVQKAASMTLQKKLKEKILSRYTWKQAALQTLDVYKSILR